MVAEDLAAVADGELPPAEALVVVLPLLEAVAESVPLALADLPVYFTMETPLPFVHSWAEELVLEKVMSAHCGGPIESVNGIHSFVRLVLQ